MKIAVISDLHIGGGDVVDPFGHEEGSFLRFLSFLEQEFERIVLLGDIWETLSGTVYGDPARELRRAREAHPRIAARLEQAQYSYVHGNHDLIAGAAEGAPDHLTLEANGSRLLFTHGHHHDLLAGRARWISDLAVWLGGWVKRLGMRSLYRIGEELEIAAGAASLDPERCTFRRWAFEVARRRNADIVVTGHTHLAAYGEREGRLFLNSGTCKDGRFSFLAMDTARGDYSVRSAW